jgi:hypothetical protein
MQLGPAPCAGLESAQGAEALAEIDAAVFAKGGDEQVENDDDPDDDSENEDATHGVSAFLAGLGTVN